MSYRARFERLFAELRARPEVTVRVAEIGPPTPEPVIEAARAVAAAAWPAGMAELYRELSSVDLEYSVAGSGGNGGGVHIPTVTDVWDHAGHEDELWFDWLVEESPDHPFTRIRPIDRFVPEAYAVLYSVPGDAPATVHYHYCGEELTPTGLSYEQWLERLFVARGATYWLQLAMGPSTKRTWVEENLERVAALFPDFVPSALHPPRPFSPIA
jgi:hypothetical protein